MPKDNAKKILTSPKASREDIEDAIDWLKRDINYVYLHHPELRDSIEESRSLILQLRDKLNSQSKSPSYWDGDRDE